MTTPAPATAGEDFQELLDRAASLVERIGNKLRELVNKINRMLSMVPDALMPDWVVQRLQTEVSRMNGLYNKLAMKVAEFFNSPGWPPALFDAGDSWVDDVAVPSAKTEDQVNANHMKVDDYWKGSAASKYKGTLGDQQAAFAAMADVARKIKNLLHQAARGIRNFWVAIGIALVSLLAAIIAAVAAVVSAVPTAGIGAVLGAIAAILAFLVALGSAAWAIFIEFENIKVAAEGMREEAQLNTSFDGDKWPKATTEGKWKAD